MLKRQGYVQALAHADHIACICCNIGEADDPPLVLQHQDELGAVALTT
jgi:hypothetical protein